MFIEAVREPAKLIQPSNSAESDVELADVLLQQGNA
jgi:hypothetical protein